MAPSTTAKMLTDLLARMEPEVAKAFTDAMTLWRDSIDLSALVRAIAANDIPMAIASLHLGPASLQVFLDTLQNAYKLAGLGTAQIFPTLRSPQTGAKLVIQFNGRDPRAEAWLQNQAATLVTGLTDAQQMAARVILSSGLSRGDGPPTIALDLVGRTSGGGPRQGGIIGLSAPQAQFLADAKTELLSTDPALLKNYLNRVLRDKRFDSIVQEAIDSGNPIAAANRTRMLVSYSNRLLKLRGTTIARTEVLPALHAAQDESVRQAVATGALQQKNVTKTWMTALDSRVRDSHIGLQGQKQPLNQPFVSPLGSQMMFPGDVSLGALVEDIVNCRCISPIRVDFLAGVV